MSHAVFGQSSQRPHAGLLEPCELGPLRLRNRMVMAPMTRTRAHPDGRATPMMAAYYAQRATAGLIVSECIAVRGDSAGIVRAPGLHTSAQVEAWAGVTEAVHRQGGLMVAQLWHGGRCSHASLQPDGLAPIGPSPIAAEGLIFTPHGRAPYSVPRALAREEIPALVEAFGRATERARAAGFDAVELHAAYGYLPDQFLQDGANHRDDDYGGPVENRARFLFEVVDAMAAAWSPGRVGVKISPSNTSYGIRDADPLATFSHAIRGLSQRRLLYLHLMEADVTDLLKRVLRVPRVIETFRPLFDGPVIGNCGFDYAKACAAVEAGQVDLVSFGKLFLANPDLPERFARGAALNAPDFSTFYGEGEKGYLDYPTLT